MATTTNPIVGTTWTEIVDNETDYFFLSLPSDAGVTIEVLVWDTSGDEANIDKKGAVLSAENQESISRTVIGNGYIYAKSRNEETIVVLCK